jgi:hypothetical protein
MLRDPSNDSLKIRQWQFVPTTIDGTAVPVCLTVTVVTRSE